MTVDEMIRELQRLRDDGEVQLHAQVEIDGFDEFTFVVSNGVVCIDTELNVDDEEDGGAGDLDGASADLLEMLREEPLRTLIHEAAESGAHSGYGPLLAAIHGTYPEQFGAIEAAKAILDMLHDREMEREGNQTVIAAAEAVGSHVGWSRDDQCFRCVVCGEPCAEWDEEHKQAAHYDCTEPAPPL